MVDKRRLEKCTQLAERIKIALDNHKSSVVYKTLAKEAGIFPESARQNCVNLLNGNTAHGDTIYNFNKALNKLDNKEG
jgi:hypothetical protein